MRASAGSSFSLSRERSLLLVRIVREIEELVVVAARVDQLHPGRRAGDDRARRTPLYGPGGMSM